MIQEHKCVEYYFDSKQYNKMQVIENMKKEQLEFEKKKSKMSICLNEHGIYVVKLKFLKNQLSIINNKMIKNKPKVRKTYKGYETYNGNNKTYGKYKQTRTYNPI